MVSRCSTALVMRATPTSERKRVHEHGADLLVQLLAHEPPRAMQPRLDRIRLKTEEVRGVLGKCGVVDHLVLKLVARMKSSVSDYLDRVQKFR